MPYLLGKGDKIIMDAKLIAGISDQHPAKSKAKRSEIKTTVAHDEAITNSSIEWYRLTESTRHVLNAIITFTSREQLREEAKAHPDRKKINAFEKQYEEAYDLLNKNDNFKSLERMEEILNTYTPVLQGLRHSV